MALKHQSDRLGDIVKSEVAKRFSKASKQYFATACIQNEMACFARRFVNLEHQPTLDIGCASGEHTTELGDKALGLDLAFGMLQQARLTSPNKPWVNADMDSLPIADNSIAQVFSSMVMQWSTHPQSALNEVYRVLKPGGKAVILVPVEGAFWQLRQAYEKSGLKPSLLPLHSDKIWLNTAYNAGFSDVQGAKHCFVDRHQTLLALLRSISKVGASATSVQSAKQGLSKTRLAQLQECYPTVESHYALDYQCILFRLSK